MIVVEFKDKNIALPADLDQVSAYARDLKHYHEMSHDLEVTAVLVPTLYKGSRTKINSVHVLPPNELSQFLVEQARLKPGIPINALNWVNGEYAPLPSLVQAARLLFQHQPLPRIKRAEGAKLPEVVDLVLAVCHEAAATKTRHLIFVTGVPGSGKTLVGLQVAHSNRLDDLRVSRTNKKSGSPAVFLSGNGPLVEVLQDALDSKAFVAGMKKFIDYYKFKRSDLIPSEHVFIFDEAQRAWDSEQMEEKHGENISEPLALLQIAQRVPDWCVVLALVGEGQEIHKGEEAGISSWRNALDSIATESSWLVHGSNSIVSEFTSPLFTFEPDPLLNLTISLRSHVAVNLYQWVRQLLESQGRDLSQLRNLAQELMSNGFPIYLTRNLDLAKQYVRERYTGLYDRRFGLLASRYAKNLRPIGIDNTYHFQRAEQLKVGLWFNSEPNNPQSCCALSRPATEFECQGLELDFPIVCWGDDLLWDTNCWLINSLRRRSLRNPIRVKLNAYRVLLTRGRDGMIIFVPPSNEQRFDQTANFLVGAGAKLLE